MAVDFPSPAVDGQLYPDTAAGDPPLDNGRVYVFDGAAGIWNLQPASGGGSPISGALEVSAVPVMVHADTYEYNQGSIWYESNYKSARGKQIYMSDLPMYWDNQWWAAVRNKEFGEEIFVSDDGRSWTPHSRVTEDSAYTGVGTYTKYLSAHRNWAANDDVLLLLATPNTKSESSTYASIYRLQKGSTTWEEVWKPGTDGVTYTYNDLNQAAGVFFIQAYNSKEFLRSKDNGTTWEKINRDGTVAGVTVPSSKIYSGWHALPDGRIVTKMRLYTSAEPSNDVAHLVVSDDQGDTWTVLDEDLNATYPIPSGDASANYNRNNEPTVWVINGLVFSSIRVQDAAPEDWAIPGIQGTHMLFYTEDISSGIWHQAGKAMKYMWDSGWYSPQQGRYYARTYTNILMCATEEQLKNNEWVLLDDVGRKGPSKVYTGRFNQYDPLEDRLVFINSLNTFDYYTFEEAPKGLGPDDHSNQLVTKRELKEYLKAPKLSRSKTVDDQAMYKLSISSGRQQQLGANYANFQAQPQYNSHKYHVATRIAGDLTPKTGQMAWVDYIRSSGNSKVPTTGWGSNGFWAIAARDLYGMYSIINTQYFTTTQNSQQHTIKKNGCIYISARGSSSIPSYEYDPIFDVVIPFTQYSVKSGCIWFDLTTSTVIYPYANASNGSIKSLYDLQGKDTYLVHVDVFSQYTNQGAHASTSNSRHYSLNYTD